MDYTGDPGWSHSRGALDPCGEPAPKDSAGSSPDDRCLQAEHCFEHMEKCCHCGRPKDSAPHVHEWGTWDCIGLDRNEVWTRRCLCGASQSRSEKPQEPPLDCPGCGHSSANHSMGGSCFGAGCKCKSEALDLTGPQEPVCTHCQGPHDTQDCKGLEEPEAPACEHCGNWHDPEEDCIFTEPEAVSASAPHRPPYAVAYAVEGGALYEVAVPGDATVVAEDGVLQVLHPKRPVLAIVRITPMNMEESDG